MSVLDRFRCTLKITCSTVENNKITSVEDYLYNPFSAVGFPAKISCLSRSGGSPELESVRYSRFFLYSKIEVHESFPMCSWFDKTSYPDLPLFLKKLSIVRHRNFVRVLSLINSRVKIHKSFFKLNKGEKGVQYFK